MMHTQYITTCKRENLFFTTHKRINLFFPQIFPLEKKFICSVNVLLNYYGKEEYYDSMFKKTQLTKGRGGWFPNDHNNNNVWREDNSYAS